MQSGGAFFKGALAAKLQRTFDEGQHFRSSCEWSFFSVSFGLVGFFMQRAPFIQRRNKRMLSFGCRSSASLLKVTLVKSVHFGLSTGSKNGVLTVMYCQKLCKGAGSCTSFPLD